MAGLGLTVAMMQKVMAAEGPVVTAVVIPVETGKPRELQVDMTPRKRETNRILGGPATFVGQVEHLALKGGQCAMRGSAELTGLECVARAARAVVRARRRDHGAPRSCDGRPGTYRAARPARGEEPDALGLGWSTGQARNRAVLPAPFHDAELFGTLLLVRMDRKSEPVDFTLAEYNEFKKNPPPVPESGDEEDEDEDDEDDDEEDEDDEEEDDEDEEEDEEDAEDEEEEEEEEEDVEEEEEEGEEEDDEEEAEAEEEPEESEPAAPAAAATRKRKAQDDDVFEVEAELGTDLVAAATTEAEAPMPKTRGGRKLAAASGKAPAVQPKRNQRKGENGIWIGNLNFATTENDLRLFLRTCGTITRVNMAKGADGRNKG